jgi:general secretion pathway protein G
MHRKQNQIEMRLKSQRNKAFTLVELLVVILILAILAALVVPKLFGHTADAKRAKAMTDITEISNALDRFRAETDRYPTDEEGLTPLLQRPSDAAVWNGPYIAKLPTDPWGNEYQYHMIDDKNVEVRSFGADGAEGGEGDFADLTNQDESQQSQDQ